MFRILNIVFQFVIQPFLPMSRRNATERDGKIISILFLSHVLAGIVVFFGVVYDETTILEGLINCKSAWMSIILILGLLAVFSLLISSCWQRRGLGLAGPEEDPSMDLQLMFLCGFGLGALLLGGINIATHLQCINDNSNNFEWSLSLSVLNALYILFIVLQFVFLTINKRSTLKATTHFNFSIVCILAVNFALWYSSTIHTLSVVATNITRQTNKSSCFQSSKIKLKLGNKLYPILFPLQMEFHILASTLMLTLWWNSKKYVETTKMFRLLDFPRNTELNRHSSTEINGIYVLSVTLGVVLNVPIMISAVLLNFAYKWRNKNAIVCLEVSETLSSVFICVLAYTCGYKLRTISVTSRKQMLLRDYILILSSTGLMAFLMAEFMENISLFSQTKMTIVSCCLGMFETFLQTHLLISSNIERIQEFISGSLFISSCAIILLITNLSYWIFESYNSHIYLKARYFSRTDLDTVEYMFLPFVTFYRFFSGMGAYSMYKRFKPQ